MFERAHVVAGHSSNRPGLHSPHPTTQIPSTLHPPLHTHRRFCPTQPSHYPLPAPLPTTSTSTPTAPSPTILRAPRWLCQAVSEVPQAAVAHASGETEGQVEVTEGEGEVTKGEVTEGEVEMESAGPQPLTGVVRVMCVQDLPRFDLPLLLGSFRSSTCNAVAVRYGGECYLLTSAASVVYGSQLRVLLPGRPKPFPARLLHLGLDCELAALAVDAPEFWQGMTPYDLAPYELPYLQQPVSVVSYAEGQPGPRASPGTVMRTEVVTYPSAIQRLLGITVAVALSREQLGSPLVDADGACLGLVYGRSTGSGARKGGSGGGGGGNGGGERWGQGRRRVGRQRGRRGPSEASASVVPVPVVTHFLEDVRRHGRYLGFPTLGINWRRTESPALRHYCGLTPDQTGIAIMGLNPTGALAAHAAPLDVLAAVGGAAVDNDGTVPFRGGSERINITYHISQYQVGDTLTLTLLRHGVPRTVPLTLGVPHRLIPPHLSGRPPSYLVVSGLVLTPLSVPYLEGAFGRSWAVRSPVQLLRELYDHPSVGDEEVVVVAECQDLGPGSATDGYERRGVMHQRVVRANGTPVRNLRHLTQLVAEALAGVGSERSLAGGNTRTRTAAKPTTPPATRTGAASQVSSQDNEVEEVAEEVEVEVGEEVEEEAEVEVGVQEVTAETCCTSSSDVTVTTAGSSSSSSSGSEADTPDEGGEEEDGNHVSIIGDSSSSAVGSSSSDTRAAGGSEVAVAVGSDCGVGRSPPRDPSYLVLELSSRMVLVLPLRQVRQDTRELLAEYEVRHPVSEDLRPMYEAALGGKGVGGGVAARPRGRLGVGGRGRGSGTAEGASS